MKSSLLLKPNKIIYSHHTKIQSKQKNTTRVDDNRIVQNILHHRNSSSNLIAQPQTSRKNIAVSSTHSNKQNLVTNDLKLIGLNQKYKKDLNNNNKAVVNNKADLQKMQKITRLNRIYRNQSMNVSSCNDLLKQQEQSRLNLSYLISKQSTAAGKRKRTSKNIQNIKVSSNKGNNDKNIQLNRSSLSDKNIMPTKDRNNNNSKNQKLSILKQIKDKNNYNHQLQLERRVSSDYSQQKYLSKNRSTVSFAQNKFNRQDEQKVDKINKHEEQKYRKKQEKQFQFNKQYQKVQINNSLNKVIVNKKVSQCQIKQNSDSSYLKVNQNEQAYSRLKWLKIINTFFNNFYKIKQKSQKSSLQSTNPSIKDLIDYLRLFKGSSKFIPINQGYSVSFEKQISLNQLYKFLKIKLSNPIKQKNIISKSNDINNFEQTITFYKIGSIMFSEQNISSFLQKTLQEKGVVGQTKNLTAFASPSLSSSQLIKQQTQQHHKQPQSNHNISTKQDQQIVETARFQNNQNHQTGYHSCRVQNEKRGNKSFIKSQREINYENNVNKIIQAKLKRPSLSLTEQRANQNKCQNKPQYVNQTKKPKKDSINKIFNTKLSSRNSSIPQIQPANNNNRINLIKDRSSQLPKKQSICTVYSSRQTNKEQLQQISAISLIHQLDGRPFYSNNGIVQNSYNMTMNDGIQGQYRYHKQIQPCTSDYLEKPYMASFSKNYNSFKQLLFSDNFEENSINNQPVIQPYYQSFIQGSQHQKSSSQQLQYHKYTQQQQQQQIISRNYNSNSIEEYRLQSLQMNSSQLFLQSVILSNLYHTNINVSFSQQPYENNDSEFINQYNRQIQSKQKYLKFEDIVNEISSIIKSMKDFYSLNLDSLLNNSLLGKSISKQSIKIQDLTQIQQFLSQFTDYKLFRKDKKHLNQNDYFYSIKLSQSNLTSIHTKKTVENIIKNELISSYFTYIQGLRINQSPLIITNLSNVLSLCQNIKILNLSNNSIRQLDSITKIILKNIKSIEFINLSNNYIVSLKGLVNIGYAQGYYSQNHQIYQFTQLKQLHLKNNQISQISCPSLNQLSNQKMLFPLLQIIDFRSNNIKPQQKQSLINLINHSPQLNIMALKFNPITLSKSKQHNEITQKLKQKSIYQYDSLQMMSAYIKYKDITFSDSTEFCCSIIQQEEEQQSQRYNKVEDLKGKQRKLYKQTKMNSKTNIPTTKNQSIISQSQPLLQKKQKIIKKKIKSIKNIQIDNLPY